MGWKEVWEKYQMAATFAEAGEHEAARRILEEGLKQRTAPDRENRPAAASEDGALRPSHATT